MAEEQLQKPTIATVSGMIQTLEQEIADVKSGQLPESKARIVLKIRGLQLKTAELNLQYARIHKGRLPEKEMRLVNSTPSKASQRKRRTK